jgi:DnaJ family protein C protein 7
MSANQDLEQKEPSEKTDMGDEESVSDVEMVEEPVLNVGEMTPEQKADLAELRKTEGNNLYKEKKYMEALKLYNEAIELCPTCAAFFSNRAATFMMLSQYDKALEDSRRTVTLDPTFLKGHLREAKCHLAMGEPAAAVRCYEKVLETEPNNQVAKAELTQARAVQQYEESAENSYNKGDFRKVVFCMDRCIALSPECRRFRIFKAECLVFLKRYQEAQEIANDILHMENMNADAVYVRGLCLYYQDNMDKAFQHFQQVLRLAPDHNKAKAVYRKAKLLKNKKEEGNEAFRAGKLQSAYDLYTEALSIDPNNIFTNSKLYCNRATVSSKLKNFENAITDCTKAIELDDSYLKAYLRRAKCFQEMEQYEEAVRDYEKIYKMDKTRDNKRLLQDAKLELKKSKRKDYYKILGVGKDASEDEIKKAYRKRALLHHPDRHSNASDGEKKEQEKKFKEVGEAYTVLSDSKKKMRYDSGQDLEDLDGSSFGDFDPNTIFQAFFAGGPGGGFSFHGGHGHSSQSFPGGFSFQFG